MEPSRREDLPRDVVTLVEAAAYGLGVRNGRWRVELYLEDGRIRKWTRQEEGGRDDLRRLDEKEHAHGDDPRL